MRHLSYLSYVVRHKSRVMIHAARLGIPIRGLTHDLSKFSPIEWLGIGRQFYASSPEEKAGNEGLFRDAKAHHRARNEHEIDHWYRGNEEPERIPEPVLREVVADWAAFQGLAWRLEGIKGLAAKSYLNWGKDYSFHPVSRAWLEDFLVVRRDEGSGAGAS